MTKVLLAMILLFCGPAIMAAGSGGGGVSMPSAVQQSPAQVAASSYKAGLRYKKRAWRQEEKALSAATEEKRQKFLAKAAKNYERAIKKQSSALKADPRHHEAANELGYGLRRLGHYQQAIEWYDHALQLQPGFLEAIEYRGEAYMAMGNIDGAKHAYMELFRNDRALADQLLTAMEAWVVERGSSPAESIDLGGFAQWVAERKELAALTQDVSFNESRNW